MNKKFQLLLTTTLTITETARQIRKRICKEITIIVLTSYEFSEIEEEAKAAGIDAFIAKPLFRSRLTATLRQFTSGKTEKRVSVSCQ